MGLLTKEQILAAEDRRYELVGVPEWGGTVRVGEMSALQRDRWDAALIKRREGADDLSVRALVVAFCIVDDAGAPIFTSEDVVALGAKSGKALDRVFEVAARINALTKASAEEQRGN